MATPLLRLPTKLRENSYGMAHSLLCTPSRRPYNTVENYNILSRSIIKPRLTAKPFILPRISRTTLHRSQARLNSNKQIPATTPNPTPPLGTSNPIPPSLTLSQRFRQLSREYGWSAVGIYFLLSALDFPFCFLAVRVIGTERIGHWEHVIVGLVWRTFTLNGRVGMRGDSPDAGYINANAQSDKSAKDAEAEEAPKEVTVERGNRLGDTMEDRRWTWGVEEADEALKKSDASKSSRTPIFVNVTVLVGGANQHSL